MNYILLALTVLPLLGCIFSFVISKKNLRNIIISVFSIVIIIVGIIFSYKFIILGANTVTLSKNPLNVDKIALCVFGIEVLLLLYIIWRGISANRFLSPILALVQMSGLCYFEFFIHPNFKDDFVAIDSLSMILILLVSIMGPLILIFAMGYMKEHEEHLHLRKSKQPQFFGIIFFFLFAMNTLAMTNNLSWLCAFWEITTLCSFLLIQHDKTEISVNNSFTTLDLNMIGGVAFIFGIIFIYNFTGITTISEIIELNGIGNSLLALPIVLFIIAGMTKSAQFPFQKWLLGAMVAPTPVSALLHSSTMVNAGVYLILRMSSAIAGSVIGNLTAIAGGFTFMSASALAISQSNGKKVLAYSTIANLGLIVCFAGIGTHASISAGIFLMIFHALSKGLLFLSVGTIEQKIGSRNIEDMQGMLKIMPFTTAVLSAGMVSMLLPPFGVLISKWIAIECAVKFPLVLIFIIMGSAFTVVFWAKWLGIVTTSSYKKNFPKEKIFNTTKIILSLILTMVILASILIQPIFDLVIKSSIPNSLSVYGFSMNSVSCGIGIWSDYTKIGSFVVIPFFILIILLVLCLPYLIFKLKSNEIRPPYTGGELANDDIRGIDFMGPCDKIDKVIVRNYYYHNIFSEKILDIPLLIISLIIILIMLGVVI